MPVLELALFLAFGAAGGVLAWRTGLGLVRAAVLCGLVAVTASALASLVARGRRPSPGAVSVDHATGSVGSGACRSCHPGEHASWHRSFHRTMTQAATPEAALGPWDGVRLEIEGRSVELSRRGDELWARLPDPDFVAKATLAGAPEPNALAPLVSRRVVITTGSHHHQVYWVRTERQQELRLLPITYLVADQRYVARRDSFLQPPDAPQHAVRWNSNCIQCHATRPEPGLVDDTELFASKAAELGIACEACHGPGAAHVAKHQEPLGRFAAHRAHERDPSIVNPARLSAERSSEVCGQCHSYFVPREPERWWHVGFADYRPGDTLADTRTLLTFGGAALGASSADVPAQPAEATPPSVPASVDATAESLFWADGTIRVGGREWNGLRASACFLDGSGKRQISCLSCHSMHDSEPNDQLRHGESVNTPCVRCHEEQGARLTEHTHHAPASAGSSCVACHMPLTSYALFKTIRSHRIDSPSAVRTATTGRPNACNLCHLDRSLRWTAETLAQWANQPPAGAELGSDARRMLDEDTPRAHFELLAGDAASRAVAAAAFGRPEAQHGSNRGASALALARLVDDPYAAVRKIACDSLRTFAELRDLSCDFAAAPELRRSQLRATYSRARTLFAANANGPGEEAAFAERIQSLLGRRDHTPMTISE
jgi:predicted CXXCH cytochrome family protein